MGYAPGVRIQLRDNSAYSVVENPNTVAGIVGYASKGELNKIIPVANTGELGVKLGFGYQSYKYNQGMYAANAVLDAGGEVEFVRPYGEEISRTDAYKRDLKTDCFVVAYDKNAALYSDSKPKTSLNIKHFASTRFKTDGAADFGVTRKINNISETVATGKNVEFNVDASENFADSAASRKYEIDENTLCTDMVMFAIMNRDPSNANRAYDRYEVVSVDDSISSPNVTCTLANKPVFVIGDTVFIPKTSNKTEKGTSGASVKATVENIVDRTVTLSIEDPTYFVGNVNRPDVIIFSDGDNAIADGFDYLNIKTAVAGSSVKNFSVLKWGVENTKPSASIVDGSMIEFFDKNHTAYSIRFVGGVSPFTTRTTFTAYSQDSGSKDVTLTVTDAASKNVIEGDELTLTLDGTDAKLTVKTVAETSIVCSCETTLSPASWEYDSSVTSSADGKTLSFSKFADASESGIYEADIRSITTVAENDNWSYVANVVADTIQSKVGFSRVAVVNDINSVSGADIKVDPSSTYDYSVGDLVGIVRSSNTVDTFTDANVLAAAENGKVFTIKAINTMAGTITVDSDVAALTTGVKFQLINFSTTNSTVYVATTEYNDTYDVADMFMVSGYTMYVSKADQNTANFDVTGVNYLNATPPKFVPEVDKSDVVLADSDIGASFMALGLAKTKYVDINFDGNPIQVFTLTDEGINIARMYMAVRYRFNGTLYEFEGTVADYQYNGRQLGIKDAAEYELENSGLEFVLNDSGVLEYFLENNSYDLSQTIVNGVLNGSSTAISFNDEDPAIANDAVWTYSPLNNNSGSTLTTVWSLFVNKDSSDVDMLVAAGMAINSPFTRKNETLNTQVMQAMLNVCEARKDCFAIFDGVNEPDINKAVKKLIVADGFGSTHGRWGFLYDGRGVFQDSLYTYSNVEVMKSVQLASIITANRQSGIFWIPAAGDEAYVPSAWGTKELFTRTYSSEDKNCDHAKLSDIHVNATRVNKDGMRIWGDFTLQMEDTAFNQMHVTMLVAGIHKMFYKYLDHKVFKLNTTILRSQITSDLQDKLNMIIRQNPQGLINGKVICDDTNNTQDIIDQNFLIVDLKLLPPKTTRWIILRTTVESTKNGKNISTTIVSE